MGGFTDKQDTVGIQQPFETAANGGGGGDRPSRTNSKKSAKSGTNLLQKMPVDTSCTFVCLVGQWYDVSDEK